MLERLEQIINERKNASVLESYSAQLLAKGSKAVTKKWGEEAVELILASGEKDKEAILAETGDVLYHLLVLLQAHAITLEEVEGVLTQRQTQSGLDEKQSREEKNDL